VGLWPEIATLHCLYICPSCTIVTELFEHYSYSEYTSILSIPLHCYPARLRLELVIMVIITLARHLISTISLAIHLISLIASSPLAEVSHHPGAPIPSILDSNTVEIGNQAPLYLGILSKLSVSVHR